jgi:hypothetical protein
VAHLVFKDIVVLLCPPLTLVYMCNLYYAEMEDLEQREGTTLDRLGDS